MNVPHASAGQQDLFDALALLARQLTIQKLFKYNPCNFVAVPEHITGDCQRKSGVRARPIRKTSDAKRGEHCEIYRNICEIMRAIRSNCRRSGFAYNPRLYDDQSRGGDQTRKNDDDADAKLPDRFRKRRRSTD